MKSKSQIIIPAATLAAASQALMAMAPTSDLTDIAKSTSRFDTLAIDTATTAKGQEIIRQVHPAIISAFKLDSDLLDKGYAEVAQASGGTNYLRDSTATGETFFSCYSNCHSACHGSRGWR